MDPDWMIELRQAAALDAQAKLDAARARTNLRRAVLDALTAGASELGVAKITGRSRDRIRAWRGK